jgi:hypothetical protein
MRELRGSLRPLGALLLASAALVAGCGGDEEYANRPRPPAPIVVSASIGTDRVSVSPRRFGAGPVELKVANLTDRALRLTLETLGRGPGRRQETGPINPRETASLKVDVEQGDYAVAVSGRGIDPARLRVGAQRPSAQNDLMLP